MGKGYNQQERKEKKALKALEKKRQQEKKDNSNNGLVIPKTRQRKPQRRQEFLTFEKFNLDPAINRLEGDSSRSHMFLDTSVLISFHPCMRLYEAYISLIEGHDRFDNQSEKNIMQTITEISNFYQKFLKNENVHIPKEIKKEYYGLFKRGLQICQYNNERELIKPMRNIFNSIEKNNQKIKEFRTRESDLFHQVYDIIPKEIVTESDNPSEVDRRLVATAIAYGLITGNDTSIVSHDKGIRATIEQVYRILVEHPKKLNPIGQKLKDTRVLSYDFGINNKDIYLRRNKEFIINPSRPTYR